MGLPIVQGTVPLADDFNLFQPRAHDGANVADYLDSMRPMTALVQLDEYSGTANCVWMIVSENVLFYKRDDNDITSASNPDGSVRVDQLGRRWKQLHGDITQAVEEIAAEAFTSAQLAEAARDAALATGKVYPTITAGLASIAPGQYFSVPSSVVSRGYLDLYLNSAGTAVLQKTYPGLDAILAVLAFLVSSAPPGYAWSVSDSSVAGRAALAVRDDGTTEAAALQTQLLNGVSVSDLLAMLPIVTGLSANFPATAPVGYQWAVSDPFGRAALAVRDDGTTEAVAVKTKTVNGVPVANLVQGATSSARFSGGSFGAELVYINNTGQSLGEGSNGGNLTPTQEYDTVAFPSKSGGIAPTAYVPLTTQATGWSGRGEWPGAGMAGHVKALIAAEQGIAYTAQLYQMLLQNNAWGGTSISQLSKGGAYGYADAIAGITAGRSIAQAELRTFKHLATLWTHGEQDATVGTSTATYKAALKQLIADYSADTKVITGQTEDVHLICSQTATNQVTTTMLIAVAQAEAAAEDARIHLACPLYMLAFYDYQHINSVSSKLLGAYYGLVYKRVVIDGEAWTPLKPLSSFRQGKLLTVKFSTPVRPLVLDVVSLPAQANYGFSLLDNMGAALTITAVSVVGPDTVRITCASVIPAGSELRYGFNQMTGRADPFIGGGGNLRDSQGDKIIYDALQMPLHNFSIIFKLPV